MTTIDDTKYSMEVLRALSMDDLYDRFKALKDGYSINKNTLTGTSTPSLSQYKNSFENIAKCVSSSQKWVSTGTIGFIGDNVSSSLNCDGDCSLLYELRSDINKSKEQISAFSANTSRLATQADNINKNKRILLTRQARYELAVERNNHRRKMILTVASLNTLLLLFYYMMISD